MEYDDLLQYAHEGLWKACVNYDKNQSGFETYAINNIRWAVLDGTNRESSTFKFNPNDKPGDEEVYSLIGYDSPVTSSTSACESLIVSEIISSDEDVESDYIHKLKAIEILQQLSDREKQVIIYKEQGLKNIEIAEKLNLTPQAISKMLVGIRNKVKTEKEEIN